MARHRSRSVGFKRQVAQEFLAGDSLHGLAKRHDISRNLVRSNACVPPVGKDGAGAFDGGQSGRHAFGTDGERSGRRPDPGLRGADRRSRAPGRQAGARARVVSKGARHVGPRPKSAPLSVIAGPSASPSRKDAVRWGSRVPPAATRRGERPMTPPWSRRGTPTRPRSRPAAGGACRPLSANRAGSSTTRI